MRRLVFPLLTIALAACGATGDQPQADHMSANEADALNAAAEMLDNSAYPPRGNAAAPAPPDQKMDPALPPAE